MRRSQRMFVCRSRDERPNGPITGGSISALKVARREAKRYEVRAQQSQSRERPWLRPLKGLIGLEKQDPASHGRFGARVEPMLALEAVFAQIGIEAPGPISEKVSNCRIGRVGNAALELVVRNEPRSQRSKRFGKFLSGLTVDHCLEQSNDLLRRPGTTSIQPRRARQASTGRASCFTVRSSAFIAVMLPPLDRSPGRSRRGCL